MQFMLFTCITAAPNVLFQTAMEKAFPTKTIPRSERQKIDGKDHSSDDMLLQKHGHLNIRNTVIKFFLDQSLSASVNTMLFICVLGCIKGRSLEYIQHDLHEVSDTDSQRRYFLLTVSTELLGPALRWLSVLAHSLPAEFGRRALGVPRTCGKQSWSGLGSLYELSLTKEEAGEQQRFGLDVVWVCEFWTRWRGLNGPCAEISVVRKVQATPARTRDFACSHR